MSVEPEKMFARETDAVGALWCFQVGGENHFKLTGMIGADEAQRVLASYNLLSRLTLAGLLRLTPEQVEAALIDADTARLRIGELETANAVLVKACQDQLNEIRAYQGEQEFEEGSIVKGWCDDLKSAIEKGTATPAVSPSNARQL